MSSVACDLIRGGKSAASARTGELNPDTRNVWATRPMAETCKMDGEVVWEVGGTAASGKKVISHPNPHVRRSTCKGGSAASIAVALTPAAGLAANPASGKMWQPARHLPHQPPPSCLPAQMC